MKDAELIALFTDWSRRRREWDRVLWAGPACLIIGIAIGVCVR